MAVLFTVFQMVMLEFSTPFRYNMKYSFIICGCAFIKLGRRETMT